MSDVMFAIELVEGKDEPLGAPLKEYSTEGKTVGLLLRLTKSLQGRGSIVLLDSGFCVLKGIIKLREVGIFATALTKKRRYWPRYVDGDALKEHFKDKDPGERDALKGTFNSQLFYIYGMKESDYVLLFMTSFGSTARLGKLQQRKTTDGRSVTFKYPEVCHVYYAYRDCVDNHNGRRMYPIAIEEQIKTIRWPYRVFQFLLGITEVNCNNVMHYFQQNELLEQIDFRYQLGDELINNDYMKVEEYDALFGKLRTKRTQQIEHKLVSPPPYRKFKGSQLVKCKCRYPQWKCCDKKTRVRTYCICSPGVI